MSRLIRHGGTSIHLAEGLEENTYEKESPDGVWEVYEEMCFSYRALFTTQRTLREVLSEFEGFLRDPIAVLNGSKLTRLGKLGDDTLAQADSRNDTHLCIFNGGEGLRRLWYCGPEQETKKMIRDGFPFLGVEIPSYDENLLGICYRLSNFPVTDELKGELRAFMLPKEPIGRMQVIYPQGYEFGAEERRLHIV